MHFMGVSPFFRGNARRPPNYPDRDQGPNYRIWVLQDTVSGDNALLLDCLLPTCRNGCIIDQADLECLPWERETVGFWLDVPETLLQLLVDQEVNPAGAKCRDNPSKTAATHRMYGWLFRGDSFGSACRVEPHPNA